MLGSLAEERKNNQKTNNNKTNHTKRKKRNKTKLEISVFELKIGPTGTNIPPKSPPRPPKRSPRGPQNALKTIFGDKKRPKEPKESPNTQRVRACHPFWVDLESPKVTQEAPKSTQKEAKRAPTRSQDNLRIENAVFQTGCYFP